MNEHSNKKAVGEGISVSSGSPYESIIGFARAECVGNIVAGGGTTAGSGGKMVGVGDRAAQTRAILETIGKVQGRWHADRGRDPHARLSRGHRPLGGGRHGEVFGDIRPAASILEVLRFINPEWLVVIDADAVAPSAGG